jgi:radical SAM superfamily enzyme YgiQ (UPF0313 family)
MKVKLILPSLTEAGSPFWRPIKYSLFPPLGLATIAGFLSREDEIEILDEHVESLALDDAPDLVLIQVYITNAYRAYSIADAYKNRNIYVALGGLHVTSLPEEAAQHADTIFLGPGEDIFPMFLNDFRRGKPLSRYHSKERSLEMLPPVRYDLIKRHLYLVPNSLVVSRGCPFHCDFCYKESFFKGGKSFYTQRVDEALAVIEKFPGRHLYFLDDHLFANEKFAYSLFEGMKGMNRVFQAAGTVKSVLSGNLIEKAAEAGLRSLFVGFETLAIENLRLANKLHNVRYPYSLVTKRLHDNGIMINGSFVYGFDTDDKDVFRRTVEWSVAESITTATFHILTPYPGTILFEKLEKDNRITHRQWDRYDTRHVVYKPLHMTEKELEDGYWWAYKQFYSLPNILKAGLNHDSIRHSIKHLAYSFGWKKMEPLWKVIIHTGQLPIMRPVLETVLSTINRPTNYEEKEKITDKEIQNRLIA